MAGDDFDTTVEQLYGGPPDRFIADRDAAAKRARASGDRELATRIKQLRRPTAAAALLNRHRRSGDTDDLSALVAFGAKLRKAQRELDVPAMKTLNAERIPHIAAVIETIAAAEVEETGNELTATVREQLSETLTAAIADADAAQAVLTGRLVSALHYSGFGEVDLSEAVVPRSESSQPPGPAPAADDVAAEGLAETNETSTSSATAAKDAAAAAKDGGAAAERAAAARAARDLEEALAILAKAEHAEQAAQQAADLAERALAAAEHTAQRARDRTTRAAQERTAAEEAVTQARSRVSPS